MTGVAFFILLLYTTFTAHRMGHSRTFGSLFIFFLIATCYVTASEPEAGNPYMKMIDKPYASYAMKLNDIRYEMDYLLSREQADSLQVYMAEATAASGTERWKFEQRFQTMSYRLHYEDGYTPEDIKQDYKDICREALEVKDTIVYLRSLQALIHLYWNYTKEYEEAFDHANILMKELENMQTSVLPEKLYSYQMVADMYYRFKDYDESELYYNKILREPEEAIKLHLMQSTYNGLALIARYRDNDLETSDRYLRQILSIPPHPTATDIHTRSWDAIGQGNLGYNQFLRKNYTEAIPKLDSARIQMAGLNDFSYAAFMGVALADIYLTLDNKPMCKHYIDLVEDYNRQLSQYLHPVNLYPILCRYYLSIGNNKLGQQYMDSVIATQKRTVEEFDMLKLRRVEQRSYKLEQQIKEEELEAEQHRSEQYRQLMIFITIGFLLSVTFIALYIFLHLRKRDAYRMLVKKNQELANSGEFHPKTDEAEQTADPPTSQSPREAALMESIRQVMEEEKVYTQPDLDLTRLSEIVNAGRTSVSNAINHCTGMSITQYINEYRVNEAIRIMSTPANATWTIDIIADRAGFNDRKSFHRIFKKNTGLAPSEFRSNMTAGQ